MNEQEPEIDDDGNGDDTNAQSASSQNDDDFETIEQIDYDDNGNVILSESDKIDPRTMAMYCALAEERN